MRVIGLSKSYGSRVLFEDFCLQADRGLIEVKGPSGCGKSTLLKILTGYERADSGTVELGSYAYCGQDNTIYPELSLRKNMQKLLGGDRTGSTAVYIEKLSFARFLDSPIIELSGGERKKAEIIFALSQTAEAYFLDEPFASLDEQSQAALSDILFGLSRHRLVVCVNHEMALPNRQPDCRLVFDGNGAIRSEGQPIVDGKVPSLPIERRPLARAAMFYRFTHQRLREFLKFILGVSSIVLLTFGAAFTNTKSPNQINAAALAADPFSVHPISLGKGTGEGGLLEDPVELAQIIKDEACVYFELPYLDVYSILPSTSSALLYVDESVSFDLNQVGINGRDYIIPVERLTVDKRDSALTDFSCQAIAEWFIADNHSENLLLLPRAFGLDILELGCGALLFDGIEAPVTLPSLDVFRPGVIGVVESSEAKAPISGQEGFDLRLNHDDFSPIASLSDTGVRLTVNGSSELPVSMSFDAYLVALFSSNWGQEHFLFDRAVFNRLSAFGELRVGGVIQDASAGWTYQVLLFAFGGICLLAYLIMALLSGYSRNSSALISREVLGHLGLDKKRLSVGLFGTSLLAYLPVVALSAILYPAVLIPMANYQNMVVLYGEDRPDGYYYYSEQPANPFYDSIQSPVRFVSFEWVYLFVVLAFVAIMVAEWLALAKSISTRRDPFRFNRFGGEQDRGLDQKKNGEDD